MKIKTLLALFLGATLILAACGDSDDGGSGGGGESDPALVAAIAAEIQSDGGGTGELSDEDANCIAERAVRGIGIARLAELGVTADAVGAIDEIGFTDDEIGTVVKGFSDCVDLGQLMAESLAADGSISSDDAECVADNFPSDLIENMLTATFNGDDPTEGDVGDELFGAIFEIFAECNITP